MVSLTALRLRAARARIAAACTPPSVDARLGSVVLREDQCASAARVVAAIARDGGCLLADDVGRGKTYVALAVAREWTRPLVVMPAALRATWTEAMRRAGVPCALVSHEELSRSRLPRDPPDGIIVDESHHFRSTDARRYSALATLAAGARLLLLSATPLQNRVRDLAAQVALFHGARAFGLDAAALAAFVVRGGAVAAGLLPAVAPPRWTRPPMDDSAVLEAILALPPPARPIDGGDAGVLRTIGLVRAWASSRAALRATIRRRRRIAAAIESSAAEGRVPTRRELGAWHGVDGAIQLGFASLLASAAAEPARAGDLLEAVAVEHAALDRLDATIAATADPDDARAAVLRGIRAAHAHDGVLAFTELATTAHAYFAKLRDARAVGLLTAREARIASGRLARDALLERFAPSARQVRPPVERERVSLLVATDLLSEGIDLQDASVVVHLDLPWNPARLAQRVGRVRRPGGAAMVHSYLVAPPAGAELLLDVERRLRDKLSAAARAVGGSIEVVPRLASCPQRAAPDEGRATQRGETAERVARWASPPRDRPRRRPERTIVAAVECREAGWLAALDDGRLVAALNPEPANADDAVARAVRLCDGPPRSLAPGEATACIAACGRWIDAEMLARQCGQVPASRAPDRTVDRRVALALARTPRHLQAAAAARASQLIGSASVPRSLGAERALQRLLDEPETHGDLEWLARAARLARMSARGRPPGERAARVVALIALGPRVGAA
jgi:superfamily II DNA or RNA helicase